MWRFFKLTNFKFFATPLRDIPIGCKDAVLPQCPLKSDTVICLTYEQNTKKPYKDKLCFFRALALHFHAKERLEEETWKLFTLFLINSTNPDHSKFQGVCMDDISSLEGIEGIKFLIYDIDFLTAKWLGNLHDEASKSKRSVFSWYDIIVMFVMWTKSMYSSRFSAVHLTIHFSKRLETWSVTWLAAVNEWRI